MRHLTAIPIAILVALAAFPAAGAEGEPPAPPQAPSLNGSYNPETQDLTLTWEPDPSWPAGAAVYKLYRNGHVILETVGNGTVRDLDFWVEGAREYTLTVTLPGMNESAPSLPFRVVKDAMVPSNCQVASVSIYTRPPGASYTVYDECLPG